MHVISGVLKPYDWGVVDGLSSWIGPTGGPQAELWFGRHPSGPSPVVGGTATLADFPDHAGMPLVKILAASTPLSLQVHPDAEMAERGFAAEADLAMSHRLFADDAEKTEMLVALTPFDTHVGWRDTLHAAEALDRAGAPRSVVEAAAAGRQVDAIQHILTMDRADCAQIVAALVGAATAAHWPTAAVSALARVAASYPGDPGVLVTVLLDHHTLAPGEALAVPAGVIHSYVDGLAIEVMTSSDNVLRLGLTSKTVAVEAALQALREDREAMLLREVSTERRPAGMPFALRVVAAERIVAEAGEHRVILALEGDTAVGGTLVEAGRAAVLAPAEPSIEIDVPGHAVLVTGAA